MGTEINAQFSLLIELTFCSIANPMSELPFFGIKIQVSAHRAFLDQRTRNKIHHILHE